MKKLFTFVMMIMMVLLTACSAKPSGTEDSQEEAQAQTTIQPTTAQPTTAQPTTVQPTTEKTNEDNKKSANRAYLSHLREHSEWFTDVKYGVGNVIKEHSIAFTDLNSDGINELIYLHPDDIEHTGYQCLCVVTYRDNEIKTLYDQPVASYAGADSYLWVVLGENSKLYSVVDQSGAAQIIEYQYKNGKLDPNTVAEETKKTLYPREDNSFSVNGKDCTLQEFLNYKDNVLKSAVAVLNYDHNTDIYAKDISMSYQETCKYLGGETDSAGWQELYLQALDELETDYYQGYKLIYIDDDNIPELLAIGVNRTTPGILYWINNGKLCSEKFQLDGFYYFEKKNIFLSHAVYYPVQWDHINKIDGSKISTDSEGEINTLSGEEYYKWNGKDLGSLDAYTSARKEVFDIDSALNMSGSKSYSEICNEIKNS